ncbi:MAG: multi-sensor hybrid histidine kinase [Rhizobacter sp.]|nr:multi-sensor hybrid histidine kinase [Rhizobacter sp.]
MHRLASIACAAAATAYFLWMWQRSATFGWRVVPVATVLSMFPLIGLSVWIARSRHRPGLALSVLAWPMFVLLSLLMLAQGGASGTAMWWLLLVPVATLHAGFLKSGLTMAVLLAIQTVAWTLLPIGLPTWALIAPATNLQRAIAAAGSGFSIALIVASNLHWRFRVRQQLEEARRTADAALDVKARFLAHMSHEIRTPLHGVSGAIDLLRRSRLDAGQQQALDILDHSNKVLTHWVETLLDHSRLDQSAAPSNSRPMTTSDPLFESVEPGRPDFVTSSMPAPFDGLPIVSDVAPVPTPVPRPSTPHASSTLPYANMGRTTPSPSSTSSPSLWARPPSAPDIRHRPARPDSRPLVLLVEDHPVNQLLAHTMLEQIGCDVTVASDGLEAVERFEAARDRPFDLVLMDCQMPVMDGFAASRAIRSLEVREHRLPTPIVAMTANSEAEGAPACREAGMDDYVTKPVAMSRLTQAVTDWTWVPPGPRAMSTP